MARWFGDCSRLPQEPPSIPGSRPERNSCEDKSDFMDSGADRQSDSSPRTSRHWVVPRRPYDGQVRPDIYPSSCQGNSEAMEFTGVKIGPRIRYTPYTIPRSRRRDITHKGDPSQGNVERESKSSEEGMEGNRQNGNNKKFLKVRVPLSVPYGEKNMLDLSQGECEVPFTQDKVTIPEIPLGGPNAAPKEGISKYIEMMKPVIKMKQSVPREQDDIQVCEFLGRHSASGVMANDPEPGPNLRSDPGASLQISEGNMPTALSCHSVGRPNTMREAAECNSLELSKNQLPAQCEGMLDKVKEPEPEEMCAGRKPLGTTLPDEPTNVSDLVDLFPKVLCLERQQLPHTIVPDTEGRKRLPLGKGSVFGSDTLENLALKFLKQYYWIYDCADRQGLLDAYHEDACFSMTFPSHPEDLALSSLSKYFKDSLNMKKRKDSVPRTQLLKRTKGEIVAFLRMLPPTQHDLNSIVVDMGIQTENMIYFSVSGKFKELGRMCEVRDCTFTRTFVLTASSNSSICILNDQLAVTNVSRKETQSGFFTPGPSFWPPPSQEQQ